MAQKYKTVLSFAFCSFFLSSIGTQAAVNVDEDEIYLPPYLQSFLGSDHMNVTSIQNKKREVRPGEWLEFGDAIDLGPSSAAVYIIQRENIQWVGGAVFQAKLGNREHALGEEPPYEIHFTRGWMRVWVKPDADHHVIKIFSNNLYLTTDNAVFWMNTHEGLTEMYLQSGEVKDSENHPYAAKTFVTWEGKSHQIKYTSNGWDPIALDVRLAGLYPNFVKLAHQGNENWEKDKSESIYADLRKKGWSKADRLQPEEVPHKKTAP